jgi:hypothetical protein
MVTSGDLATVQTLSSLKLVTILSVPVLIPAMKDSARVMF